jgi:asparagine synthase (glutamine-hydrolysing)
MCGIVGILAFEAQHPLVTNPLIDSMRDTMIHRGPDAAGVFRDEHIALGQRRLSIIDLAGGDQPMSNPEQTVWVLNNGEIYNYRELRAQLEAQGCQFRTQSDTEVIVQGYQVYGERVVEHLVGMFALAIWDSQAKRLFLARDRAGQKPLYYALLPQGLLFASELKALLQYPALPRQLNPDAVYEYFHYQSIPDPLTIFQGVAKLPAAHRLACDLTGKLEIQRYWQWSLHHPQPSPLSYSEAVSETQRLLEAAVCSQMVSDVPLGALLSGGVDSSAVVAMMTRHAAGRVKTFSIGFAASEYDERPFAQAVAQFCGTEHQELVVEPESIHEVLPRLARQYDEPFADSSALPTYYVCKMARQHVTVALAGDGGDEAFAGYERHAKFLRLARQWGWLPPAWVEPLQRRLPMGMQGQRTLRLLGVPLQERYQRMVAIYEAHEIAQLLTFPGQIRPLISNLMAGDLPLLSQLQLADFEVYLPSTVLTKVDRASMLTSLEVRAPFLDHQLLDFLGHLPAEWMLGKRLLKDAIRGLVPDSVLTRPKAGFAVPLEYWFKGDFGHFLSAILLDSQTRQRGYLNIPALERLLQRASQPSSNLTLHLWPLLMFELWCREYGA